MISVYLLVGAGIIFCLTVARRRRPWAHIIPDLVLKHRQLLFLSLTRCPPYFLCSILWITPFPMASSCLPWFLPSLPSRVISRHLKPRVLYKCRQHSRLLSLSLPSTILWLLSHFLCTCSWFGAEHYCALWYSSSEAFPSNVGSQKSHFFRSCYKTGDSAGFCYLSEQNFDAICHFYEQLLKIRSLSEDMNV